MMTNGENLKPCEFRPFPNDAGLSGTPRGQVNGGLPFGSPMDVVQDGPE